MICDYDSYYVCWLQQGETSLFSLNYRPKAELQIDYNHCATNTIVEQKHMAFNYVGSKNFKSRTHVEIETVPKITHTQER